MINEDRHIRIFISSTFRDMQDERDILVKKIFPQLRKMCEERAVTWTEVDLRWGITTEQAAEGKVLPLCLTEIHRCRPFFIGLLGERYGWVPDLKSIPSDLFDSQPWLKNHLQQSVTELEILYGIFSSESVHGQAYFYFRNPKFLETLPTERRQNFVSENTEAKQNLERLKMKIRCAFEERICVLRENYSTPEELGEWILNDFTTLINKLYPKDKIPSPLDQEAARHETYARSKRFGFVGREDLLYHLKEYITNTNKPLFLYGEPGCGKSALLAEWVARWQKDNPEDFIIQHYIGATLDSADWQGIVHRILIELKQAFTIIDDIPIHPDALLNALTEWTVKTNSLRRIILVIDGLNQIADASEASQLRWLPVFFPSNFHVLLSTGRCENLDVLRERGWTEINVPLFSKEDVSAVTLAYFKVYSKTLPEAIIKKLNVTPATRNALFLRSVLDELRQFGLYEKLFEKADVYLSASNLPELFDHILTRWHDDFGKDTEHPDLVQLSLCYIACSRFGLAETELLDLLGRNGEPLPHRFWTPFSIAAENSILLRARLLNFGHDYLRVAVQKRWLDNSQTKNKIHLRMACYFAESTIGSIRILDELPWQLRQTSAWGKLYTLLSNVTFYSALYHHRHSDVLSAWSDIERESSHQMINTYVSVLQNPSDFPDDILDVVANHLDVTGHWPELIIFRGKLVEYYIRSGKINRLATSLLSQASLHVQKGNLDEGLHLLSRLDSLVWFSQEPWILQDFLRIKSMILWQKGELDEAMDILEAREQFCRKVPGFNHQLAGTLVHKSFIRQLQGDQAVAENLLSEALRISRESGDMHSYQAVVGEIGLLLLKEGNLNGAMDKFSEQERICRELGDMVSLAGCLGNQGTLLSMVGKRTDALNMFKEMENLANKIQHQVLYHVSRSEQAQQIYNTNSVEDALTMNGEAVNFFRIHGLTERLATSLFVQGHIYSFMLDPEKADKTYQEGIIQLQKISSTREVADMMYKAGNHYRAVFLSYQRPLKGFLTFNDFSHHTERASHVDRHLEYAKKYLTRAVEIFPDSAEFNESLADVLDRSGDIDGAIASYRRVLQIQPDWIDVKVQLADLLMSKRSLIVSDGIQEVIILLENAVIAKPEDHIIRQKFTNALARSGRFKDSAKSILIAVSVHPEWSQSHFELVAALANAGFSVDINNAIQELLKKEIDNATILYVLGISYQTLGKQNEAVKTYQMGIKLDPSNAVLYYNLGNAMKITGDEEACIRNQLYAITLSNTLAEPHYVLGVLYMKAKKIPEAKKHFYSFLKLGQPYLGAYLDEAQFSLNLLEGRLTGK